MCELCHEMLEALKGVIPYMEAAEEAGLVGEKDAIGQLRRCAWRLRKHKTQSVPIKSQLGPAGGAMSKQKIRVRKTPHGLHPYVATIKGEVQYGWGNTPKEARECLMQRLSRRQR